MTDAGTRRPAPFTHWGTVYVEDGSSPDADPIALLSEWDPAVIAARRHTAESSSDSDA